MAPYPAANRQGVVRGQVARGLVQRGFKHSAEDRAENAELAVRRRVTAERTQPVVRVGRDTVALCVDDHPAFDAGNEKIVVFVVILQADCAGVGFAVGGVVRQIRLEEGQEVLLEGLVVG